ncbi:MAG: hypothetical protein JNJ57_01020 [Saprospiraceae bacterium]|nr:hypothetical protein [Saprospiraceae bacterium]
MAYSKLHDFEQEFLKMKFIEIIRKNTGHAFHPTQTLKSFEVLLKDMAEKFQNLGIKVSIAETVDGAQLNFETQGDNLTYACALRSLRDFFYSSDKYKNDTAFLNCSYLYISNGTYDRTSFWKKNPEVYPVISQSEINNLLDLAWGKYQKEVGGEASLKELPNYMISMIENMKLVDGCSSEEELGSFIEKPISSYPCQIWITTLNTVYYYISNGQNARNDYISLNEISPIEQSNISNESNIQLQDDKRPFMALNMITTGVILLLIFSCFNSIWWLYFIPFAFLFWGLGLFFALRSVMKNSFENGRTISKFWVWWFGESSVTMNTLFGKVRIGIVHDDSFEVQKSLGDLRKNFNVQLIEYKIAVENNDLENELIKDKIEGLYILFTKKAYKLSYSAIRSFSLQNRDIPVVYKKFTGLEDKPIEFGNSVSNSEGDGLWHLLSQAIKRTKRWRENAKIFRDYSNIALRLLAICLITCLSIILTQKYFYVTLQSENEKRGNNIVSLSGLYLKTNADQLTKELELIDTAELNLSIWHLEQSNKRALQLTRSDLSIDNEPVFFNLRGTGIVTCAFNVLHSDSDLIAVTSFKDSLGNFESFKIYNNFGIDNISAEDCQFCRDEQPSRNKTIQGFLCVMDANSKMLIILEVKHYVNFSRKLLNTPSGRNHLCMKLKKILSEAIKSFDVNTFPKPIKEYNSEC